MILFTKLHQKNSPHPVWPFTQAQYQHIYIYISHRVAACWLWVAMVTNRCVGCGPHYCWWQLYIKLGRLSFVMLVVVEWLVLALEFGGCCGRISAVGFGNVGLIDYFNGVCESYCVIVCDDWMMSRSMKEKAHIKVYMVRPTSTMRKPLTFTYYI